MSHSPYKYWVHHWNVQRHRNQSSRFVLYLCYVIVPMEQSALKNVNSCLNTNIYSYLETSGGQSSNPYLNIAHFSAIELIKNLWQLKTAVFMHWCLKPCCSIRIIKLFNKQENIWFFLHVKLILYCLQMECVPPPAWVCPWIYTLTLRPTPCRYEVMYTR